MYKQVYTLELKCQCTRCCNSADLMGTPRPRSRRTMNTAAFFLERRERADFAAFDKIMKRNGGERPMPEDVIP